MGRTRRLSKPTEYTPLSEEEIKALGYIALGHANVHALAVFALGSLAELSIGLVSALTERETTDRLLGKLDAVAEFRLHEEPDALLRFREWIGRAKKANGRRNSALHTPWLKAVEDGTLQDTKVTPTGQLKVKSMPSGEPNYRCTREVT
jgi:hypothetical protein